jgi:hypothetical protein
LYSQGIIDWRWSPVENMEEKTKAAKPTVRKKGIEFDWRKDVDQALF